MFFSYFFMNMLWYTLEAPCQSDSNEYHNMFLWRNKKNSVVFDWEKCPGLSYVDIHTAELYMWIIS